MTTVNKNTSAKLPIYNHTLKPNNSKPNTLKPNNSKPNSLTHKNNKLNQNNFIPKSVLKQKPNSNIKNTVKSKNVESFSDYTTDNTNCNKIIKRNIENGGIICENKLRKTINTTILHRTFDIRNPTYLVEPMYFDFNLQNKQRCFKLNSNSKTILTNHPFLDVGYEKI